MERARRNSLVIDPGFDKSGLSRRDLLSIERIVVQYPDISKIVLFGSRAMGKWHNGSDVDLAIMDKKIGEKTLLRLSSDLKESSIPYLFDLVHYHSISTPALRKHIDRHGIVFYEAGR